MSEFNEWDQSQSNGGAPSDLPVPSGQPGEESGAWPLSVGLDAAIDAAAGPAAMPNRRRVNEGILLLVGFLLIACAVLFVMRKTGAMDLSKGTSADEIKIEQALAQFTAGPGKTAGVDGLLYDTDTVVAIFTHDPSQKQVQIDQLAENPFAMPGAAAAPDEMIETVSNPADLRQQIRAQKIRAELKKYELQTVVEGKVPMAVISGKVVQAGQKLGSFEVKSIEKMSVILQVDGNAYRLQMKSPEVPTD